MNKETLDRYDAEPEVRVTVTERKIPNYKPTIRGWHEFLWGCVLWAAVVLAHEAMRLNFGIEQLVLGGGASLLFWRVLASRFTARVGNTFKLPNKQGEIEFTTIRKERN